nr:MAG TPA: hypothetical protein [Herelleviridae sp.]
MPSLLTIIRSTNICCNLSLLIIINLSGLMS